MKENQNTGWKESWRDDHLKWVCGFANAQGGILEIGRNDQGQVVGLTGAAKLLEDIPNKMRDLLGILADVDLLEENGTGPFLAEQDRRALGTRYRFPVSPLVIWMRAC